MPSRSFWRAKRIFPVHFWLALLVIVGGMNGFCWPSMAKGGSLFPRIEGWKQKETVQVFTPDNLYEYINGAAELYLTYGFQELQVAEYEGERDGLIIVDIYRHATPLYAFGILQPGTASPQPLPGHRRSGILGTGGPQFFCPAENYVKITNHKATGKDQETLKNFARQVNTKLGSQSSLPKIFKCLSKGRKKEIF